MKSLFGVTIIGGAYAFSSERVHALVQKPLLHSSGPSHSILHDGECQLSIPSSIVDPAANFRSNISFATRSLEDSRVLASQQKDFPWTFWPECYSNENITEPYCVFSDQTFASGRGIFILTEKDFAYTMLEKPAFQNPDTLSRMNHYFNPPFTQHEFPGKGRGLIANKTLNRGDQIFASTPILITDPDAYDLSTADRLALLHRGVATLPPSSQDRFWELMGHTSDDPIDDRINTNNFEVTIDGISQSALFPEMAMLNHDCRPNAAYFFDEASMSQYVHAIHTIQPGEEITITYIDNEKIRATRMRKLKRNWGFECGCSSCTAHPALTQESDTRLLQIENLAKALDDWTAKSAATPEVAELLISLVKQERLDATLATAYKHAAEVYSSFGRKFEAAKYARLSTELSMLDKGFNDGDVGHMRKMAANPELSWSWKKRVPVKTGCGCGGSHGHS
ncbi:hypothetical protein NX059_011179 [Plenodomus lindquistii]|nr:hypothetical protein NX059_011179 [Plenodomus lindquistii]